MTEPEQREELPVRALGEAGLSYSLCAILPTILALIVSLILAAAKAENGDAAKYLSFLLPQLCFTGIAFLYFKRSKAPLRETVRPCPWYYFIIALVLQFGLLLCLGELNGYLLKGLVALGYKPNLTEDSLPALDGWKLLPAVLVIALLPALFEETIFRGITAGSMRRAGWGTASAVLVSGAMFSLFHHNPEQTVYQFICGVAYALLALRSGSVLPSMLAHFANNATVLFLTAFGALDEGGNLIMAKSSYIALVVCAGACFLGAMLFLILFSKKREEKPFLVSDGKKYFLFAAAGIAVCAIQWVVLLVEGLL